MARFESFEIFQVFRVDNSHVDALTNLGSVFGIIMKRVIQFAFQDEPSSEAQKLTEVISASPSEDLHKEIINYLERSVLLDNQVDAMKINGGYVMLLGELYPFYFLGLIRSVQVEKNVRKF